MSLLALIPARGGSKGIPNKNIRLLAGIPLISHTIKAAQAVPEISRLVVSTDSPAIAEIAKEFGAEVPFLRPPELARDDTPGIAPVLHALEQFPESTDILLLQPTSPLRNQSDIKGILDLQRKFQYASVVSVCQTEKHPQWTYRMNTCGSLSPFLKSSPADSRQQLEPVYCLNGALYLCSRTWLKNEGKLVGNGTVGYPMPPERSVDIDTPLDWLWAETLIQHAGGEW